MNLGYPVFIGVLTYLHANKRQ